jgi:PRTRC genetic system ThiF family protein
MELNYNYLNASPIVLRQDYSHIQLILVGCGGNGSHMASYLSGLYSVLSSQGKNVDVAFVDPDTVASRNIPRQAFSSAEVGLNKAEQMALRYGAFRGMKITAYPETFDHSRFSYYWNTLTLIIGCTDNGLARQEIAKALECNREDRLPNVWWLDLGNDHHSGQILLGCAPTPGHLKIAFGLEGKCLALPSPALVHPDLLEDEPPVEEPLGCAEMALRSQQLDSVNRVCAGWAASYLDQLFKGTLKTWATYFNVETKNAMSRYVSPQEIEQAVLAKKR